jgi:hypothetical protein
MQVLFFQIRHLTASGPKIVQKVHRLFQAQAVNFFVDGEFKKENFKKFPEKG